MSQSANTEFDDRHPRWPVLLISVGLHCGFFLVLVGAYSGNRSGTTPSPQVRSVGMAIVHRMPDRTKYVTTPQPNPSETTPMVPPSSVSGFRPPIDFGKVMSDLNGTFGEGAGRSGRGKFGNRESPINGLIELADGRTINELTTRELIPGDARAGLGAGRTTTQVFGVSGTGSTFVYVFDRSESMIHPRSAPLRASKTELIRSLQTLTARQQFQIIFYNERPEVFKAFGDRTGLVLGEEATIARAVEFVERTTATGGTEHELALKLALRLAPDVIFFLTDAKIQTISDASLDDLTRRAQDAGTTIHTIQFGTGPQPPQTFAERLATRNSGDYRYVDVDSLD